ncbi:MAG: eCIS core domain-containing protein, partial [Ginsengibacter sp.]
MQLSQRNKVSEPVAKIADCKSFFQPKLAINEPNDIYEQEADAMADRVMQMPDQSSKSKFFSPPVIQRKCAHCEEEEKKTLQRKEVSNDTTFANAPTESFVSSLEGKGQSLSNDERNFFEPRFGYDFSNVQVHTNAEANQSAKEINALAYTHGNNIVFGADRYQPNTTAGKKLMAHELTHVVQQGRKETVKRKESNDAQGPVSVKILWQGTVFASLYYFIRPVCKSEDEAKQIVGRLLLDNSFTYILKNGNNVSLKDFEYVENFQKEQTINIYEGALQMIIDATGNKTKAEFFRMLEANKAADQKASQLVKELQNEGFDIHYENSWLQNFLKGVGQSSLSASASEAYNKMKDNASSFEKGPAFYTGINLGFPAGVIEDLWDNIKGILLLAWQLMKAQFELATDPIGFYDKIKEEVLNLWQVISADPVQLGILAGNALAAKIKKEFVNVNSFNQGFALGEIVGEVVTEIALLFVGVEEVSALAKVAEGTKLGGTIMKALKESAVIGKVGELIKGEKAVKAGEESAKAITEAEKL